MDQSWYRRLALVVVLLAAAIYYSLPSIIYFSLPAETRRSEKAVKEHIPSWLPETRFNFGIDLQGGLHLVMGVDTEKAVLDAADRFASAVYDELEDDGVTLEKARREGSVPEVTFVMKSEGDWAALKEVLDGWRPAYAVMNRSGTTVVVGMADERREEIASEAVDQALKTIGNRINQTGTKEPDVRKRGSDSILIQLAGVTKEDQANVRDNVIGRTAQLELKIVDETNPYFATLASAEDKPDSVSLRSDSMGSSTRDATNRPFLVGTNREELKAFLAKHERELPPDLEAGIEEVTPRGGVGEPEYYTYLFDRRPGITGDFLESASVSFDPEKNSYQVNMSFDRKGAVIFENLTRENVGRQMAIVLDGAVSSAPRIDEPIPNGRARISIGGGRTRDEALVEAKDLALVLKAGALPAPVTVQEERTVGATLGDDAVSKGQMALLVALVGVLAIMFIYYRGAGFVGVIALVVNMIYLFAGLAIAGVTLTLPGIAGLALTIGMAVDANIIQFERIREELRSGKAARAAVDAGFDKAFSAIFDANVTTLLACVVLGQFGSGPIRGFAVTLGIGVIINTFTAVIVPRLGLDYFTRGRRVKALSI